MKSLDLNELQPKIRGAVEFFRALDYETTDSGDGSAFQEGMEGAFEMPMVAITWDRPWSLIAATKHIHNALAELIPTSLFYVEASFAPEDGVAIIIITGVGLLQLTKEMGLAIAAGTERA